jgi:hypothetical protein
MHLLWGPVRLALLIVALVASVVAFPAATSHAQAPPQQPQCSDGIDNDSDGAIDGFDQGCGGGSDNDESDSIYAGIVTVTVALPVVTLQGTVTHGVVTVSKLLIRANRGSIVEISCSGKHCPFKTIRRTMVTTSLRITKLERKLRPSLTLTMRIARAGQLGKFVTYKVRRGISPVRFDACLDQDTGNVRGCFLD